MRAIVLELEEFDLYAFIHTLSFFFSLQFLIFLLFNVHQSTSGSDSQAASGRGRSSLSTHSQRYSDSAGSPAAADTGVRSSRSRSRSTA